MRDVYTRILEESGCKALACFGNENFSYITGVMLPFAKYYPDRHFSVIRTDNDVCTVIVPPDWEDAVKDQKSDYKVVTYDENKGKYPEPFINSVSNTLIELGLNESKIGFDSNNTPKRIIEIIKEKLPKINFISIDKILIENRMIKNSSEIKEIENACEYADRGITHGLNHLEGTISVTGYSIPEYAERIRVHIFESGGSGVGQLLVTVGTNSQKLYSPAKGNFKEGQIQRNDVTVHSLCYWCNVGRMSYIGEPSQEYVKSYEKNQQLKLFTEKLLKPGIKCSEIFDKVSEESKKSGIHLCHEIIGHGVGVGQIEPPYIGKFDQTALKTGMVLALDIMTPGPNMELIHDKDVYVITEGGTRKLSWYRSWDQLYAVIGFRAVH